MTEETTTLITPEAPAPAAPASTALAMVTPMQLLSMAVSQNADIAKLEKLMELQERWEAKEARRAYVEAMAAFKGEAIEIFKRKEVDFTNRSGVRTHYKHAELSDVVEAVGPALSKHGFSWSWSNKQEKGWLTVTCTLRHRLGHSESVELMGPHDDSGGKNAIQQIISTKTYLERHTLKSICGVAERGEDDDGNGAGERADPQSETVTQPRAGKPEVRPPSARAPQATDVTPRPARAPAAPAAVDNNPATAGEIAYLSNKVKAKNTTVAAARQAAGLPEGDTLEGLTKSDFNALKGVLL